MRLGSFAAWGPRCPACAAAALVLAEEAAVADDEVVTGRLVCADPACRHEYPVIDGIPVIVADLARLLRDRGVDLLLRDDLPEAALGMLGDALGPDSWLDVLRQGLSTYAWDSYADLDPAEAPGPHAPGAARRCLARLLALAPNGTEAEETGPRRILDLGCGGGRTAFELAAAHPGAAVLGIDTNLALLRLARGAARGTVGYGRRRVGMVYDERRFAVALPGAARVDFWACDALALPFAPGCADMVTALNLLDCVPDPAALLRAMAALLAPAGRLLLATPFDWSSRATPEAQWIGGHSARGEWRGAAEPLLALLLSGGHPSGPPGLRVLATAEQAWHTRLHDRAAVSYQTHLVAAERTVPAGQEELNRQ